MSSSRSGRIFTARFHFFAATAATAAKRFGWVSLPPKPPPMRRTMIVTAFDGHAEDVGDHVLHLGRVLGRGVDGDVVVLAGDGEGDHALEVEVVLAADAHARPLSRCGAAAIAAATSPRSSFSGSVTKG